MSSPLRIVIFTSSTSPYAPLILREFLSTSSNHSVTVLVARAKRTHSGWRALMKTVRAAGMRYSAVKLILFMSIGVRRMIEQFLSVPSRHYPSIEELCEFRAIPLHTIGSVRDASTLELLKQLRPDVVLSVLFEQIFPPELLHIPRIAALNIHPAPLPRYAGIAPTFWVLSNGERMAGTTIHYLEKGVDTGDIFSQRLFGVVQGESVHSLYLECCAAGSSLLGDVITRIASNELPRQRQDTDRRTYFSNPTKKGYKNLRAAGFKLCTLSDLFRSPSVVRSLRSALAKKQTASGA